MFEGTSSHRWTTRHEYQKIRHINLLNPSKLARDLVTVCLCYLLFNESTFLTVCCYFNFFKYCKIINIRGGFTFVDFAGIRKTYLILHDNKYTESLDKDINFLNTFLCLKFSKVENFTDKVIMNNSLRQITTYFLHHWCCKTYVDFWLFLFWLVVYGLFISLLDMIGFWEKIGSIFVLF